MAGYHTIIYQKEGPVATIKLNRPETRNALNLQICLDLLDALRDANGDERVRVVVITGEGPVFCSGLDLRMARDQTPQEAQRFGVAFQEVRDIIKRVDKPVIAKVNGDAYGGGTHLANSCDLVVASTKARFAIREINAGLQSGGACFFDIGRLRSMEMALTGRPILAEEAERWGLPNKAVEPEQLDAAAQEYIDMLINLPPLGLAHTKRTTNFLMELAGWDAFRKYAQEIRTVLLGTEDSKEAQAAFLEKRKPVFKGR